MRRKEMCRVVGMHPGTFNVHRANGNLPFEVRDAGGWTDYSDEEAALLFIAKGYSNSSGRRAWSWVCRALRGASVGDGCEWIVVSGGNAIPCESLEAAMDAYGQTAQTAVSIFNFKHALDVVRWRREELRRAA